MWVWKVSQERRAASIAATVSATKHQLGGRGELSFPASPSLSQAGSLAEHPLPVGQKGHGKSAVTELSLGKNNLFVVVLLQTFNHKWRVYLVRIQVQALTLPLLSSVSLAKSLRSASRVDNRHCLSLGVPVLAGTVRAEL